MTRSCVLRRIVLSFLEFFDKAKIGPRSATGNLKSRKPPEFKLVANYTHVAGVVW